MNKPLIFLGCNSHITLYSEVCVRNNIPIAGIIDSDYFGNTPTLEGIPFIGSEKDIDFIELAKSHDFFIAVNPVPHNKRNVSKRNNFINLVDQYNLPCANLIDPQSRIGMFDVILGKGIYIGYCASINSHVTIGDHCQLHHQVGVGHHSIVGKNVVFQRKSCVSGDTIVEDNSYIGIGVRVVGKNPLKVGSGSNILAGLTVMRNVEPGETVTPFSNRKVYDRVVVE